MRKSRFIETQILSILKEAEAEAKAKAEAEASRKGENLFRQRGISNATYYQWKSKYGGMEASDLELMKEIEAENNKLKRMYADMALEN